MEFVSSSSLIPTGTHDAVTNGPAWPLPPRPPQAAAPHRVVHLPLHHAAAAASLLPTRCSYLPTEIFFPSTFGFFASDFFFLNFDFFFLWNLF
jgi:hypothetical protein